MEIEYINNIKSELMELLSKPINTNNIKLIGELAKVIYYLKKIEMNGEETDDIEDELKGSEKYYKLYLTTGDIEYLQMAKDELSHAKKFIVELKLNDKNNPKIHEYQEKYIELEDKYNKKTEKHGFLKGGVSNA